MCRLVLRFCCTTFYIFCSRRRDAVGCAVLRSRRYHVHALEVVRSRSMMCAVSVCLSVCDGGSVGGTGMGWCPEK